MHLSMSVPSHRISASASSQTCGRRHGDSSAIAAADESSSKSRCRCEPNRPYLYKTRRHQKLARSSHRDVLYCLQTRSNHARDRTRWEGTGWGPLSLPSAPTHYDGNTMAGRPAPTESPAAAAAAPRATRAAQRPRSAPVHACAHARKLGRVCPNVRVCVRMHTLGLSGTDDESGDSR